MAADHGKVISFSKEFHNENGQSNILLRRLNEQRRDGRFCDIILSTGEEKFSAHRNVLAASSPYFDSMFGERFSEGRKKEVELKSVSSVGLSRVLNYVYMGSLSLDEGNVEDILAAADHLLLNDVKEFCDDFVTDMICKLEYELSPKEQTHEKAGLVMKLVQMAKLYCLGSAEMAGERAVYGLFDLVAQSQEFLALSYSDVLEYVTSDLNSAVTEDVILDSVLSWISYDVENRQNFLEDLLNQVRLVRASAETLAKARRHPLISGRPECQSCVIDAMEYHLQPLSQSQSQTQQTRLRIAETSHILSFAIFTISEDMKSFHLYDCVHSRWEALPAPKVLSDCYVAGCLVSCGDTVYVSIEDPRCDVTTTLMAYAPLRNEWAECHIPGSLAAGCIDFIECNHQLYAYQYAKNKNNFYVYECEDNSWKRLISIEGDRYDCIVSHRRGLVCFTFGRGVVTVVENDTPRSYQRIISLPYPDVSNVYRCYKGSFAVEFSSAPHKLLVFNLNSWSSSWSKFGQCGLTDVILSNRGCQTFTADIMSVFVLAAGTSSTGGDAAERGNGLEQAHLFQVSGEERSCLPSHPGFKGALLMSPFSTSSNRTNMVATLLQQQGTTRWLAEW